MDHVIRLRKGLAMVPFSLSLSLSMLIKRQREERESEGGRKRKYIYIIYIERDVYRDIFYIYRKKQRDRKKS